MNKSLKIIIPITVITVIAVVTIVLVLVLGKKKKGGGGDPGPGPAPGPGPGPSPGPSPSPPTPRPTPAPGPPSPPAKTGPNYGPSACINGVDNNVCFTPYQHILGSPALVSAKENEKNSNSPIGNAIQTLEGQGAHVWFATGSAGVANNGDPSGKTGSTGNNHGRCYQIRLNPDNVEGHENHLILQSINTSLPNAFDIQLVAGGAGAFPDNGWGTCTALWGTNLYDVNNGRAINIQDSKLCHDTSGYEGTDKHFFESTCEAYFNDIDNNMYSDKEDAKESFIQSCTNTMRYRLGCPSNSNNHKGSTWQPIECPIELEKVTGLRVLSRPPEKPAIANNNYGGMETSIGENLKWFTYDFGDNEVGINEKETWSKDYGVQVSQMMDCRSPDSAQCFKINKEMDVDPKYQATYNIDVDGKIINDKGRHGCHNLPFVGTFSSEAGGLNTNPGCEQPRLKGNFTNSLGDSQNGAFCRWQKKVTDGNKFTKGNCPLAFPPNESSCERYKNNQCSNMLTDKVILGSDLSTLSLKEPQYWQSGGGGGGTTGGFVCYYNNICFPNGHKLDTNICGTEKKYCESCKEGGGSYGKPDGTTYKHIFYATKPTSLSESTIKYLNSTKPPPTIFCKDPSYEPPSPEPNPKKEGQCGQQTVYQGPGYKADPVTGITTPDSFDKCYVSNSEIYDDIKKCGN